MQLSRGRTFWMSRKAMQRLMVRRYLAYLRNNRRPRGWMRVHRGQVCQRQSWRGAGGADYIQPFMLREMGEVLSRPVTNDPTYLKRTTLATSWMMKCSVMREKQGDDLGANSVVAKFSIQTKNDWNRVVTGHGERCSDSGYILIQWDSGVFRRL